MIIKVPVYLEIPDVDQNLIPEIVEFFGEQFTKTCRKARFALIPPQIFKNNSRKDLENTIKILSKKEAFEHLRVKK